MRGTTYKCNLKLDQRFCLIVGFLVQQDWGRLVGKYSHAGAESLLES